VGRLVFWCGCGDVLRQAELRSAIGQKHRGGFGGEALAPVAAVKRVLDLCFGLTAWRDKASESNDRARLALDHGKHAIREERLLSFDMSEASGYFGVPSDPIAKRVRVEREGAVKNQTPSKMIRSGFAPVRRA